METETETGAQKAVLAIIKGAHAAEDLYRAKLQKESYPAWRSGNGETIDEVIAQYQAAVDEYERAKDYLNALEDAAGHSQHDADCSYFDNYTGEPPCNCGYAAVERRLRGLRRE